MEKSAKNMEEVAAQIDGKSRWRSRRSEELLMGLIASYSLVEKDES